MEDAIDLISRADQSLNSLEDKEIERLSAALDASYKNLESELLRKYPAYTADSQPGLLATQRGLLLANDLREKMILINPEQEKQIEARFDRLLNTASKDGTTLGQELIKLQQGDDFVKATANVPIEAVAYSARDATKRLKKHDEKFQEEASVLIQQGMIQGWGAQRTAGQLRQRLGVTKGRAETIVRTETISAQDSATRAAYKSAGIDHIIRIGTQDHRICGYCAARAGNVYPVDTPIAIHPRDRCYSAPFFPDEETRNSKQSAWLRKHAQDARDRSEDEPNEGAAPFEKAAGLRAPRPAWTPIDGYKDRDLQRRGELLAQSLLVRDVIAYKPETQEDRQRKEFMQALLIGAALAGLSISSYYLARARYRAGFPLSAAMAEDMIQDLLLTDPEGKNQITLIAGGFAGQNGRSGLEYAPVFQDLLPGHRVVGVPTPEFDSDAGFANDSMRNITDNWSNVVGTAVIKGRNMSSVRMAAMAAAYYRQYGKPVNLIGYSGGGMVASEAHEILKLMGVPTKTATIGTPWFGFTDLSPNEMIGLVGRGDPLGQLPIQNRVQLDDVPDHWLDKYWDSPLFQRELQQFFGITEPPPPVPPERQLRPAQGDFIDAIIVDAYPELALLGQDELKALPGKVQQKILAGRAAAQILPAAHEVKGLLDGFAARGLLTGTEVKGLLDGLQVRGLLTGTEIAGLIEGTSIKGILAGSEVSGLLEGFRARGELTGTEVKGLLDGFEAKGLLTGTEVRGLIEGVNIKGILTATEVKGLLEGFKVKGLLAGQQIAGLIEGLEVAGLLKGVNVRGELTGVEVAGLLEGLEIRGLLGQVNIRGLLTSLQVKGLLQGREVKGLIEGVNIKGALTGRLDPKQLPAIAVDRQNRTLEALYQKLAKDSGNEDALKALLRNELPQLKQLAFVPLQIPQIEQEAIRVRTAREMYRQVRSVERGMSRLASFRIRQKLQEIAGRDLPMLGKLQAYRQAILDEVRPLATPLQEFEPPGTANREMMQRFAFGGVDFVTPELKPSSPSLDLMRKLIELDLPDEVIQSVDVIYMSKQKNAAEEYWRKKLKLPTAQVPATVNLSEGSITLYRGKGNLQDAMRQIGYLVAYRKFGQLEPPIGTEYYRAMQEGRTITPYGFTSGSADFADSVAQFFLDPDRLRRFTPQRYYAISRLLDYRHPERPVSVPGQSKPDPRSIQIVDRIRDRNREISDTLKAQRAAAEQLALKQRGTKKFQAISEKVAAPVIEAELTNALTNTRLIEGSLDVLGRSVADLEQRSAQILNPFNEPYFTNTPQQIRAAQKQLKAVERRLAEIDRVSATAARIRTNAAELESALNDFATRKESLKTTAQGRDLTTAWEQLLNDLDSAEQEIVDLPRSAERAQALRDMVRLKAAIRAKETAVGVDVGALHRQAVQPKIDQLRALAESLEGLQVRGREQQNRLADYQSRLVRLPQKVDDLDPDLKARYNTVRSAKVAQSKLPQRVEQYRTLRTAYTERLAEQSGVTQKLVDDYATNRPAAINAVQFVIEERLQAINDSLTVLTALEPSSVAWLVDSRNWELSDPPGDLAIVLANQPGRTARERIQAASNEVVRLIGQVRGSASLIEQRIAYVQSITQTTREQTQRELRRWEQIRDDLADQDRLTDRQIQAFLKGEKQVKLVDVIRYGNQLLGDLEDFNRNFVELLLNQEGVDPRTIMDQSNLYRRARDAFSNETEQTRAILAAEIDQAIGTLSALENRLQRDAEQGLVFDVNGKARTIAELQAELAQAQQVTDNLLRIKQVEVRATDQDYLDVGRSRQRQEEAKVAANRDKQVESLKAELVEVNREIQKRRDAAARGQKRGIATDRLEAQQRRILRDIAKLGGGDAATET